MRMVVQLRCALLACSVAVSACEYDAIDSQATRREPRRSQAAGGTGQPDAGAVTSGSGGSAAGTGSGARGESGTDGSGESGTGGSGESGTGGGGEGSTGGGGEGSTGGGGEGSTGGGGPEPRIVFLASAPLWNDYVLAGDPSAPCPRQASSPPPSCVHAGGLREIALPDETRCQGLRASDEHGWFSWQACDDSTGSVRFTARLEPEIGLGELIDATVLAWRSNRVSVTRDGAIVATSDPLVFWQNPVRALPAASAGEIVLDEVSAVYVVNATQEAALRIAADGVALLGANGVVLRTAASSTPVLTADAGGRASFLWIEGVSVDADEHATGVDLRQLAHGVVRALTVARDEPPPAGTPAVDLRIDAEDSAISKLRSSAAAGIGIELAGARNAVSEVHVRGSASHGVVLRLVDSSLAALSVTGAGGDGIQLLGARASSLETVSVADCDGNGVKVDASSRSLDLADVVVSNNGVNGIMLDGNDHRLVRAVSANNEQSGVHIGGARSLVMHSTTVNNFKAGLWVVGSNAQIVNALCTNNRGGLTLVAGSERTLLHDLWLAENAAEDVRVEGNRSLFSGALALGSSVDCALALMQPPIAPGITSSCTNADGSTAQISVDHILQTREDLFDDGVVAGWVRSSDPANQPLGADNLRAYTAIDDWFSFSARGRHWGKPPSRPHFPNVEAFGRCVPTGTTTDPGCAIWDWRPTQADSALRDPLGDDVVTRLAALVQPEHARTQVWSAQAASACAEIPGASFSGGLCSTRFLAHAFELRDGRDNDNGLCEPGEHCMLNRNRGAYPGHGADAPVDPQQPNGPVNVPDFGDVTLRFYAENGE